MEENKEILPEIQEDTAAIQEKLAEMQAKYPDIELTPEMEELCNTGYSPEDAFRIIGFDQLYEKTGVKRANSRNRGESVGSLRGLPDTKAGYTPEQVAAMSPKEVAAKLPEIMKSLRGR